MALRDLDCTAARYTAPWYTSGYGHRVIRRPPAERFFFTARLAKGVAWSSFSTVVRRKLDMLDYAAALRDLRSPPGNRLESLRGDLAGLHSIRINQQWRVVFRWTESGAEDVRIMDYH